VSTSLTEKPNREREGKKFPKEETFYGSDSLSAPIF